MDDAVVGKTEEEDDEDGPAPCADTTLQVLCADTLQDSLRTVQSLVDAANRTAAFLRLERTDSPLGRRCVSPCFSPPSLDSGRRERIVL